MNNKFSYNWALKDAIFTKDKGKVFSCFACGGGATMGYKLAGFDVIGANDIDEKMAEVYKENHKPKHYYLESITTLAKRRDFPKELYELDILDGSPPCSSFSMSGNREKDWGKEKKFKEGQAMQVLDTLFFDFIALTKELQPKIVIAENVEGILMSKAKKYVIKIKEDFEKAGYKIQHFLLDGSRMGLPQKRKRVFFIGLRNDLCEKFIERHNLYDYLPTLKLNFNEKPILFGQIFKDYNDRPLSEHYQKFWDLKQQGDLDFSFASERMGKNKNAQFQYKFLYKNKVANTILASDQCVLFDSPRFRNFDELCECGSFPKDYNFLGIKPIYLIGMSVPPLMVAKLADEIYDQWLSKL